jgi:hypothetical protein
MKGNLRFGGTYRHHLQDRRISRERHQHKSGRQVELVWLILRSWRWGRYIPPKRRLTFSGLHGAICHKTVLCIQNVSRVTLRKRLGRPMLRCDNNIETNLKERWCMDIDWIRLIHCWVLMEMFMKYVYTEPLIPPPFVYCNLQTELSYL